jgi:hypothetical protein
MFFILIRTSNHDTPAARFDSRWGARREPQIFLILLEFGKNCLALGGMVEKVAHCLMPVACCLLPSKTF